MSIVYCIVGTLPSCLDLPYVLTTNYKAQGVIAKKKWHVNLSGKWKILQSRKSRLV